MAARDSAPLLTGLRIGNSLISLVSFKISVVAATMAAFLAALVVTRWLSAAGARRNLADNQGRRRQIDRKQRRYRLIRFDIVGLSLL